MSFSTYVRTGFYPQSYYLSADDLMERVQNNWSNIGIVSGLIAGFTFLVISQDVHFNIPLSGSVSREEIFSVLTGLSFVFALTSTLMSATIHGVVNVGGPEQICQVVRKWCVLFGVPLYCAVISVFLMLVAAFFAVGGRYASLTVWLTIVVAGGVLTLMMFVVFLIMLHGVYKQIDQLYNAHMQQQQQQQAVPMNPINNNNNNNNAPALKALATTTP